MYCAMDNNDHLIAFHDSKHVVEKYVESVKTLHDIELKVGKVKEESESKLDGKDDLYLVKYNSSYIQAGYLLYVQINMDGFIEDEIAARDVLYRIIEVNRLTDKQIKRIMRAITILEGIIYNDTHFVPTLEQLRTMKYQYDPYIYSTGILPYDL